MDAAQAGDTVLVTNGVYATGGRAVYWFMTNRVAVDRHITLASVNGPEVTIIQGYQVPGAYNGCDDGAIRCIYLTNGAVLAGFTLTNGATLYWEDEDEDAYDMDVGGGVWCESTNSVITNCILTGNSAVGGGGALGGTLSYCTLTNNSGCGANRATLNFCTLSGNSGGGAMECTLNYCTLTDHPYSGAVACTLNYCTLAGNGYPYEDYGGGAYGGTLNYCTLTGNSASYGGGACEALLNNCTLEDNVAGNGGGAYACTLNNCTLTGNSSADAGGGACYGTLNNCTLTSNRTFYRCGGGAYMATLNNCTLTDNRAEQEPFGGGGAYGGTLNYCTLKDNGAPSGGGAYEAILNNCTLTGNWASYDGGGAYGGTLNNCMLTGNSAYDGFGGGAWSAMLNNCTLAGNSSTYWSGGGACGSLLTNCILYCNTATSGGNYYESTLNYCCTTPLPAGTGNFTNAPLFVDTNGWSNLRLRAGSPCINAGDNASAAGSTDLDGRPRLVGARVDVGAYEFQGPGMSEFIGWLANYTLPTDGTADSFDSDGDGLNNWQEYRCGTDPTNALSFLRLLPPAPAGADVGLSWLSVPGRTYRLECSTNLGVTPAFFPLVTNLPGQPGTTVFTHTNAATHPPAFYRVGVE